MKSGISDASMLKSSSQRKSYAINDSQGRNNQTLCPL
jgi:hypothetical protein